MSMKLWYVALDIGCSIRKATTAGAAKNQVKREVGTNRYIKEVREATDKDIAWVRGMGGYVPKVTP